MNNNDFDDFVGFIAMINDNQTGTTKKSSGCGCLTAIAILILLVLCLVSGGF